MTAGRSASPAGEEVLAPAARGFSLEFPCEAGRTEEAQYSAGRVVPGRCEAFAPVLEAAKLG
jgi:hypothetical protein